MPQGQGPEERDADNEEYHEVSGIANALLGLADGVGNRNQENYFQWTNQGENQGGGNQSYVAPVVSVCANIGMLQEFKPGDDWRLYQKRLEQYFIANFVGEQRKVSVLLTMVGEDVNKTLRNLCDPLLPKEKSFEELCNCLKKHFSPRISVYKERKEFYELRQQEKESVSQWYAHVKHGAVNCEFGGQLENILKDRFVTGMKPGRVLNRVFEENQTTPLRDILEAPLHKEASLATSAGLETANVHKISARKTSGTTRAQNTSDNSASNDKQETHSGTNDKKNSKKEKKLCKHCGNANHNFSTCKYRTYKCKISNVIGHLAKVCSMSSDKVNFLDQADAFADVMDFVNMYCMDDSSVSVTPKIVDVNLEGQLDKMEIDSGAGISVIPKDLFDNDFQNCELKKSNKILRTYDGSTIIPIGRIESQNTYNGKTAKCLLLVINQKGKTALMGRDLMKIFDFEITEIKVVKPENVVKKYWMNIKIYLTVN